MGRLTALSKVDGGVGRHPPEVGGSDNRSKSRHRPKRPQPFQCALSTKAGCECVAHILQTLTDLDPEATVMSIDGRPLEDGGWRSSPL